MTPIYKIVYHNKDNERYLRSFANLVFVQLTPQSEIVIDFYEEYIEPLMTTVQTFEENGGYTEYNRSEDRLDISRERKCTVTMSKKQAMDMAKYILSTYGEYGDSNDN